jgi:hypothetical protein
MASTITSSEVELGSNSEYVNNSQQQNSNSEYVNNSQQQNSNSEYVNNSQQQNSNSNYVNNSQTQNSNSEPTNSTPMNTSLNTVPINTSTQMNAVSSTSTLIPLQPPNLGQNMSVPVSPVLEYTSTQKPTLTRSEEQSKADRGQAEMLEKIRGIYRVEFADIPEKFRPKAKAWVARAAYYKHTDEEQNEYIQNMIIADRHAAEVRMGIKPKQVKKYNSNSNYNPNTNSNINSNNINSLTQKVNLNGMGNALRNSATHAEERLSDIVNRSEESMLSRAKTPADRRHIHIFARETRKIAHMLAKKTREQARELERVAKEKLHQQAREILGKKKPTKYSRTKKQNNFTPIVPLRTGNRSRNLKNNTNINNFSTSGLRNMNSNNSGSLVDPYANNRSGLVNNRSGSINNMSEAGQSVNTSIKSGRSYKDPYANNRSGLNNYGNMNSSPVENTTTRQVTDDNVINSYDD